MEDGTSTSLSHICGTDTAHEVRSILDRIGDKWSLLVISLLENGTMRFMELRRDIGPISQRMLTRTLRQLERDGLVERKVLPVIPPHVEYTLTPLGQTLLVATRPIIAWATEHRSAISISQEQYDRANNQNVSPAEEAPPATHGAVPEIGHARGGTPLLVRAARKS
jgi:DNA-binding HxlR family transcriptional regulator